MYDKFYKVRGLWYHNSLNGVAMFTQDEGCCQKAQKMVVFKDGMSIDMTTGSIRGTFWIYLIFAVACFVGIVLGVILDLLILIPLCLIIYWCMSCQM